MKQLLITVLRDLGILAVIIVIVFILSPFIPVPWETTVSLLITAYAVIEIVRIMCRTDISYYTRRWPVVILFIADFICAYFLLKDGLEKLQFMKIFGMLLVMWTANLQLKIEKAEQAEQEAAGMATGEEAAGTETGEKTGTETEMEVGNSEKKESM